MTAARTRKVRAAKTQALVAGYLAARVFPHATDAGSGRPGADVLNTPGVAVEVKARRDLNLPAWLRQAAGPSRTGLPVVVHRPDGFGEGSIDDWPATLRLADLVDLLYMAGFGGHGHPMTDDPPGGDA